MAESTTLLSVADALHRLLAAFPTLEAEEVHLSHAAGRVLAHDLVSQFDLPLFENSSMDGFAIRATDVKNATASHPVQLEVVADIPAGQVADLYLKAGQAVRIMTGAPLPRGSDSVIPLEDTDHPLHDRLLGIPLKSTVSVYRSVKSGDYVRPIGQDVHAGEVILSGGTRLRSQDIGLLAMLGVSHLEVIRSPRVAIISTGDELLPIEAPIEPGKIHDSNIYMLASLVDLAGGEAIKMGIARDREEAVYEILERALTYKVDLILSSAGVSVGAFDFVRKVIAERGVLHFWQVNMRPGKPLAFGSYRGIPFIGLPGNPVSAFVGFEVFVRPALQKMLGQPAFTRPAVRVQVSEPMVSDGRESYLRGIVTNVEGHWIGQLTGHQGSGNLRSLVQANALLIIPSGVKSLPAGTEVTAWLLEDSLRDQMKDSA